MANNGLQYPIIRVQEPVRNVADNPTRFYHRRENESDEEYQLRVQQSALIVYWKDVNLELPSVLGMHSELFIY
jgi:hypothetical protein